MKKVFFISPHLDDAFFSSGALMLELMKKGHQVTVINVFTRAGNTPETISAKMFLRQTKFNNSEALYKQRVLEDKNVLKSIGIEIENLEEIEALWRKKTDMSTLRRIAGSVLHELLHIYPTYRGHIVSGKIALEDTELINRIAKKIKKIIDNPKQAIIFSPLGIGNHVDHLVVRKACEKLSPDINYWADIPYFFRESKSTKKIKNEKMYKFRITDQIILRKKERFAKKYSSQYEIVFGNSNCSNMSETIYSKQQKAPWMES